MRALALSACLLWIFLAIPSATAAQCPDCNGDSSVTVDEIVTMVNIALGTVQLVRCPPGDRNGDGLVTVDELVDAVVKALTGCPTPTTTATPTVTGTPTLTGTPTPTPVAVTVSTGNNDGPGSLRDALEQANADTRLNQIVLPADTQISLLSPLRYTGSQALEIVGQGTTLSPAGAAARGITPSGFALLDVRGRAPLRLVGLRFENSTGRGIDYRVAADASGLVRVELDGVVLTRSAGSGLRIDDSAGSAASIDLVVRASEVLRVGLAAASGDPFVGQEALHIEEAGPGSVSVSIEDSTLSINAYHALGVREAGDGDLSVALESTAIEDNGWGNTVPELRDGGVRLEEGDGGRLSVALSNVAVRRNRADGVRATESGGGDALASLSLCDIRGNNASGFVLLETDAGNLAANVSTTVLRGQAGEGIRLVEGGAGAFATRVDSSELANNGLAPYAMLSEIPGEASALICDDTLIDEPGDGDVRVTIAPCDE